MVILAAIVLILKAPLLVLKYLAQNKMLLILVIIGVALLLFSRQVGKDNPTVDIPAYQVIAPSPQIAPKVGQTSSRIYYIARQEETESQIILLRWWDYNRERWQEHNTPLPISKSDIKIYDRG